MSGVVHRALAVSLAVVAVAASATATAGTTAATTPREAIRLVAEQPRHEARVTPAGTNTTELTGSTATTAIVPGSVNRSSLSLRATYRVRVRIDTGARTVRGYVVVTAQNRSGAGIDRIELNTVMARLGGLRLGEVTVDGTVVRPSIDDQTILVPLGGVLPDGATTTVKVRFRATLRTSLSGSSWMFTKANGILDLYRWIPWVSRRTPFDRPNHGDPFVTPVSPHVTVTFVTERKMKIATTGTRTAVSADGLTQTFEATNVRDITTTLAGDYRTTSATVGDNIVRVYYRPGAPASAMLRAAKRALTELEARLGPYPYKTLKIVQTAGGFGMEGPGVAWIPTGASNLSYLVTHEVAHQWFYGLVGNDQAREPFADEAMTDMAARAVLGLRRSSRCGSAALDKTIYRYSRACYYEQVYIQGGNLLADAKKKMGPTLFWKTVRAYIADHRWGISHTRTLLRALDDASPLDLASWWGARFPKVY
jgi:hypothetical protein